MEWSEISVYCDRLSIEDLIRIENMEYMEELSSFLREKIPEIFKRDLENPESPPAKRLKKSEESSSDEESSSEKSFSS